MDYSKTKFIARTIILIIATYLIFLNEKLLMDIPKWIYFIGWVYLMFEIIITLFPDHAKHSSYGKLFKKHYQEVLDYNRDILIRIKDKTNKRTIFTFIAWLLLLYFIGFLYNMNIIKEIHIYFISILFYYFDHYCINVFCPFQKYMLKTKCCNSCRIYNWGHFMTYSPLIFVLNFYTSSLILASIIVLFQWEYLHHKYPERFYEISNANLKCQNCKITCRYNSSKTN